MTLYFAYGANLNRDSMRLRCPAANPVSSYHLPDWRLTFSGVATIQPSPGNRVPGAIWAITDECEKSLDSFEGYPTLYRKEYLDIQGHKVMFYRMNQETPWEPSSSYVDTIARGYVDWNLSLADLESAIINTLEEVDDLYRSNTIHRGDVGHDGSELTELVSLESGHDLCDLDDHGLANSITGTAKRRL